MEKERLILLQENPPEVTTRKSDEEEEDGWDYETWAEWYRIQPQRRFIGSHPRLPAREGDSGMEDL